MNRQYNTRLLSAQMNQYHSITSLNASVKLATQTVVKLIDGRC